MSHFDYKPFYQRNSALYTALLVSFVHIPLGGFTFIGTVEGGKITLSQVAEVLLEVLFPVSWHLERVSQLIWAKTR